MNNGDYETDSSRTGYKTILELAQSQEEKDTLSQIKESLNLREYDALWSIVGILQMYQRTIGEINASMKSSVFEAIKDFGDNGGIIRGAMLKEHEISFANYFFLLAGLLLYGVLTFAAGATLSNTAPSWLISNIAATANESAIHRLAHVILNAPAGWILIIVLSVPAACYTKTYYILYKLSRQNKEKALNLIILLVLILLIAVTLFIFLKLMF